MFLDRLWYTESKIMVPEDLCSLSISATGCSVGKPRRFRDVSADAYLPCLNSPVSLSCGPGNVIWECLGCCLAPITIPTSSPGSFPYLPHALQQSSKDPALPKCWEDRAWLNTSGKALEHLLIERNSLRSWCLLKLAFILGALLISEF